MTKALRFMGIMICLAVLLCFPLPGDAAKHALVIGNGNYKGSPLHTPVNDAKAMTSVLKSLGFSVVKKTDLGHREMEDAIRSFGSRLGGGDTALFYFSGHGAQVKGVNYLLPMGARIFSADEVRYKAVPAEMVLDKMERSGSQLNIVILDACRNNPFKGFKSPNQGLAPMTAVQGRETFIAYATAPGTVAWTGSGPRSIYTNYLAKAMKTRGLKIEDVFKRVRGSVLRETSGEQQPWESTSLLKDHYFASGSIVRDEPERYSGEGDFTNRYGMKFVSVPAGSFMMGSPGNEPKRDSDERQHRVKLTKGFYMQTTEVTAGQWRAFIRDTDFKTEAETGGGAFIWTGSKWEKKEGYYWDNPGFSQTDKHPVTCVSWNDVQEFLQWMNRKEGKTYRLPTEAEWEYACRAGTTTPFSFGKCLPADQANYDGNYPMPGCSKGKYRKKTVPVASFSSNAFGLYDMHGNVWEWCRDRYGDYPSGSVTDPGGPPTGSSRVLRGGGWSSYAENCRSAVRGGLSPGSRLSIYGLRLVLSPGQP
ncbi:SUMF1/EgtB/PvdO family nonheme iron enzyme [Desulfococcaceae bacterium HSG8]|nr:SUMF1/EgtB/PvdO family nonheme iron enzyme [Desulfococcaceae bacterium HSG8]